MMILKSSDREEACRKSSTVGKGAKGLLCLCFVPRSKVVRSEGVTYTPKTPERITNHVIRSSQPFAAKRASGLWRAVAENGAKCLAWCFDGGGCYWAGEACVDRPGVFKGCGRTVQLLLAWVT